MCILGMVLSPLGLIVKTFAFWAISLVPMGVVSNDKFSFPKLSNMEKSLSD